jgi:hypothetical protein
LTGKQTYYKLLIRREFPDFRNTAGLSSSYSEKRD